jgi:hypothetical protein
MKQFFLLIVLPVLVLTGSGCQSSKTSASGKMLKFNFEKGKGYDYEMTMSIDQEIEGQAIKMDGNYYYSMYVQDDENGVKNIISTIDRFLMKVDAGVFNIDIDTDKPMPPMGDMEDDKDPAKLLNGIFGAIKGQQFRMKVNPEGKVLEISGFEDMAAKIFDSLGLEQQEKVMAMAQFNQQFNGDKMKSQFERAWYIFPNKEVKVGDSWKKSTAMDAGEMQGKYNSTFKVTDIEGDMVTLEENSVIESDQPDTGTSGSVKGTIVVDSRIGLVVTADQDFTITTKAAGKTIDMKMKTKIKGKAR